jgi:hypothetical protein
MRDSTIFLTTFFPATAQQLGTKVHNHVANLPHVSASFGHLEGRIRQRKTLILLIMSRIVQLWVAKADVEIIEK